MRVLLLISILCLSQALARAQSEGVTIVKDYNGREQVQDPSKYRLVGTTQHTVVVQHYAPISQKGKEELVDIIIQNIDYYLDQVMEFSDGRMNVRKSYKQILKDLEGIVQHNVKLYDYQVEQPFAGFSQRFNDKIEIIEKLSWSTDAIKEGNSAWDNEAMAYNYVQGQIADLKDISTADLLDYAEAYVRAPEYVEFDGDLASLPPDTDTAEWVLNSPLLPIDYSLASIDAEDIGLFIEPETTPTAIPRGTDARIVELLESNNQLIQLFGEQMLMMQEELLELRRDGLSYQQEFAGLRDDIKDLQVAIREVRLDNDAVINTPGLKPLITEDSYTVRFEKNSAEISSAYRMELNEVYHLLMLDRSRKVMITGYADLSGNPELNARISRLRAQSVRRYLQAKGVPNERMISNYLGDSASRSENAADRKVELEWLAAE